MVWVPWQSSVGAGSPRGLSRAIRSQDRATVGPPARQGRGLWSSCHQGSMGNSSWWRSEWWNGQGPKSHRFPWCSFSPEGRRRAAARPPGPAGHSSCLQGKVHHYQHKHLHYENKNNSVSNKHPPTDVIFHDLGVVSVKERRGEPSQVELDVSLCCFYVPLVGNVHRFPPVGRQRDPHQTWVHTGNSPNTHSTKINANCLVFCCPLPFCLLRHCMS